MRMSSKRWNSRSAKNILLNNFQSKFDVQQGSLSETRQVSEGAERDNINLINRELNLMMFCKGHLHWQNVTINDRFRLKSFLYVHTVPKVAFGVLAAKGVIHDKQEDLQTLGAE